MYFQLLSQRLGLKHRSIRIWTGWATWVGSFIFMAWIYQTYVIQLSQHKSINSLSSWVQLHPVSILSGWRRHTSDAEREDDEQSTEWGGELQPLESLTGSVPIPSRTKTKESVASNSPLSNAEACQLLRKGLALVETRDWTAAIPLLAEGLEAIPNFTASKQPAECEKATDASIYALARSYAETSEFDLARRWTDELYAGRDMKMAEPAYHLCRRLRQTGQNALAYYYYRIAKSFDKPQASSNPGILVEPAVYDYLLDYEKSILWSYVGDIHERHSRLHAVSFSMQLLANPHLPEYLRESVLSNLQYYSVHLRGSVSILRAENSVEEEWRYSTPTFFDEGTTLIRVVNYYVADDGSYHVSPSAGERVSTKLVLADPEEPFEVMLSPAFKSRAAGDHLLHADAYILGLEDTRVCRDYARNGTVYTLSASQQYSKDGRIMNQVLAVLDLQAKQHIVQNVIQGPYPGRHDKNWIFAGGIDNVIYGWYPIIEVGAVDLKEAMLRIHTSIPSPASFEGMRGSTNGVLFQDEWWFVTHTVIYRPGQLRKYLHRLVVLDKDRKGIVRYSLPFTFEERADVEYCLGLRVETAGLTFGYSVRDRSSRVMSVGWMEVGGLFD